MCLSFVHLVPLNRLFALIENCLFFNCFLVHNGHYIISLFFLMIPRPPVSTPTDTLFPYPTLFRSRPTFSTPSSTLPSRVAPGRPPPEGGLLPRPAAQASGQCRRIPLTPFADRAASFGIPGDAAHRGGAVRHCLPRKREIGRAHV